MFISLWKTEPKEKKILQQAGEAIKEKTRAYEEVLSQNLLMKKRISLLDEKFKKTEQENISLINWMLQLQASLPPGITLVTADDFREWLMDIQVLDSNPIYANQVYRLRLRTQRARS